VIVRHPHDDEFAIIPNATLRDPRLSWKARGILGCLLSRPDNWRVIVAALVREGPDGRASVLAGLAELEAAGYLVRRGMARDDEGKFDGPDCEIYDRPQGPGDNSGTAVRLSDRGFPARGKSNAKEERIKEERRKETREGSELSPGLPPTETSIEIAFNDAMSNYPKSDGIVPARAAFFETVRRGADLSVLVDAARAYTADPNRRANEPRYTMRAARFFGPEERWRDFVDRPAPKEKTQLWRIAIERDVDGVVAQDEERRGLTMAEVDRWKTEQELGPGIVRWFGPYADNDFEREQRQPKERS
jgi:hypothetical protein